MIKAIKEFIDILFYCLQISWRASRLYTLVRVGSKLVTAGIGIGMAFAGAAVFNLLTGGTDAAPDLLRYSLLLAALTLLRLVTERLAEYCEGMHNDVLSNHVQREVMDKSVGADIAFYDSPKFHDAILSVRGDSFAIVNVVWSAMDGISACVTLISAFAILCGANALYGVLVVAAAIPSTIMSRLYTKTLYRFGLAHMQEERKMGYLGYLASSRAHVFDVRLFNLGGYIKRKYMDIWTAFFHKRRKLLKKRTILIAAVSCLPELVIAVILFRIGVDVLHGAAVIGDYSLYGGLLSQLLGAVFVLTHSVMRLYEDRLRIQNVQRFSRFANTVENTGTRTLAPDAPAGIEFRRVSFRYPGTENLVLEDISFTAAPGEKLCIIGLNGAGKSTVMKLLLRFYDADAGDIFINGHPIAEYELTSLRGAFSSFFQDEVHYAFTLRENITISDLARGGVDDGANGSNSNGGTNSDDNILRALAQADATGILDDLPQGLDSHITKEFAEDGAELSGGQYQKLALARTFYRRCAVMLLDEPSASLDPEAEQRVFAYLEAFSRGKTTVFTSHRLSNVHLADRIVLLEAGRIAEQGSHRELMARDGRYAALYRLQAGKYNAADS